MIESFKILKKLNVLLAVHVCHHTTTKQKSYNNYTIKSYIIFYSKTVPWFSPMYIEGNELCIIYSLINGSMIWSVHITFTVRVTKQHPVNISFLKD